MELSEVIVIKENKFNNSYYAYLKKTGEILIDDQASLSELKREMAKRGYQIETDISSSEGLNIRGK